jgi:hypothetical protein
VFFDFARTTGHNIWSNANHSPLAPHHIFKHGSGCGGALDEIALPAARRPIFAILESLLRNRERRKILADLGIFLFFLRVTARAARKTSGF